MTTPNQTTITVTECWNIYLTPAQAAFSTLIIEGTLSVNAIELVFSNYGTWTITNNSNGSLICIGGLPNHYGENVPSISIPSGSTATFSVFIQTYESGYGGTVS
jgi:hypothetical protein